MRFFLLLMALVLAIAFEARSQTLAVVLQVGESYLVRGVGTPRAAKSDRVRLSPISGGLEIFALKPGTSQVRIGKKIWEIQILSRDQHRTYTFLQQWSRSRLGLKALIENGRVYLRGRLLRADDWLQLRTQCKNCDYQSEFDMNSEIEAKIRLEMTTLFKKRGLPLPELRWNPQAQWLFAQKTAPPQIQSMAASMGIEISVNESVVEVAPMIRTQIFVMEVRREKTKQWGIEWPESVSAQILPTTKSPVEQLMVSAHALESTGDARILASPALLCRSGQEAEFLAGGEFPIKVFNRHQNSVIWRKYGILVKVKPIADRFGKMSLSLETEISNIDGSRVVDGIPGLLTNRVLSHFDLAKSRTIAISGLIRNDESESIKGLPGLSNIPILGSLFSSREFRENKTELVILVKPETVQLTADGR